MAEGIDITVQCDDVVKRLERTSKSMNSIRRKFLSTIGLKLKREIQKQIQISYVPNSKHTGLMKKYVVYKVPKNGGTYSFQPVEKVSVFPGRKAAARAIANNSGARIFSKKTGKFHHEIKPKAYVQLAEGVYISSGRYTQDADKIVYDELKKAGLI